MSPAEFRATLAALGLTMSALAHERQLNDRTVRYYDSGRYTIPADIAAWLRAAMADMVRLEEKLGDATDTLTPDDGSVTIVLLVYRSDDDLPADWPGKTSLPRHAATHAALMRRIGERWRARGRTVDFVYFDREAFDAWRGGTPDTPAHRAAWAAEQT